MRTSKRIAHLCLSNWFVDGVGYQENQLVKQHVQDGHEVLVIASTETHSAEGKVTYITPREYQSVEGARVIRIPYSRILPKKLMRKLRMHNGLRKLLDSFRPEVILFHGTCGWELLTVTQYVKNNPETLFYVDSHEDKYNSGRTWLSKELLHKQYYGKILRCVAPFVRKVLCYSKESMAFVEETYLISREQLELFPLGGIPIPDDEYELRRTVTRKELSLNDGQTLIVQSGKLTRRKKILESLAAFKSIENKNLRFIIVGVIEKAIENEVIARIEADERVRFLGWQSFEELTNTLCAADIYLQPGTQSVTMQQSLCCRCAVVLDDVPSHHMYVQGNGWLVERDGTLESVMGKIANADLESMKSVSHQIAKKYLDYAVLATRVLHS
jgi:1,2-diacylglycerol 3-alpha-glucosyltransferase